MGKGTKEKVRPSGQARVPRTDIHQAPEQPFVVYELVGTGKTVVRLFGMALSDMDHTAR